MSGYGDFDGGFGGGGLVRSRMRCAFVCRAFNCCCVCIWMILNCRPDSSSVPL